MTNRKVDLVVAGLDLALRIGKLQDSTLKCRQLIAINAVVCASPSFWKNHGVPESPEDLVRYPALCCPHAASPAQFQWRSGTGESGKIKMTPRMLASNGDVLCQAAIAGLGEVCEPTFTLCDALESGELVSVLNDYSWSDMALHAVYPATHFLPARTRAFIDFLVEQIGDNPVWDRDGSA